MDRRRAAGALLALAACIACSTAAPMASNQSALDLYDGPPEGCYYNFQHYGEGDRIMTNEPCLNCTCHNRMLMCYLRVCPFTKPIGQDCTVEKRADQCCPIVTCPDVPVDLLTSTSTSSPAEYGATGIGKHDKYGCSINGRYFSEGSKVPSTPNKPCEHCYCIRNMTTCVMQECTLHVDGCVPIYHKEVCCPVRYSCDHPEDEIPLLDDMTTTVRPTPGFLLTTTTLSTVTQASQDCVHDDQIFADGTLIKTEKACEHCYCMKGDIVCVIQECGTPMENEGKNCSSLPPRFGQCCPDTYICEGDELGTHQTPELTTEEILTLTSTTPPRRVIEGSGYRNEPNEPYTDIPPFDTLEIEGSGDDQSILSINESEILTPGKQTTDLADEMFLTTVKELESFSSTAEPGLGQTVVSKSETSYTEQTILHEKDVITESSKPDLNVEEEGKMDSVEKNTETTHNYVQDDKVTQEPSLTTIKDYISSSSSDSLTSKADLAVITTESTFRKEDGFPTLTEATTHKTIDEVTTENEQYKPKVTTNIDIAPTTGATEIYEDNEDKLETTSTQTNIEDEIQSKQTSTEISITTETKQDEKEGTDEYISSSTIKSESPETTSINPVENEINEDLPSIVSPGRIPGEGDCLLNGITYKNTTTVPSTNKCHTSCRCVSSIVKCDPIICSPPPEYANMDNCQPIYDSGESCCPTYICDHSKETSLPESHSQMSGTESPKPISPNECNGNECQVTEDKQILQSIEPELCTSENCALQEKQPELAACGVEGCDNADFTTPIESSQVCTDGKCEPQHSNLPCDKSTGCQVTAVKPCEGEGCAVQLEVTAKEDHLPCNNQENCYDIQPPETNEMSCKDGICTPIISSENQEDALENECNNDSCRRKESSKVPIPPICTGEQCETHKILQESTSAIPVASGEFTQTNDLNVPTTIPSEYDTSRPVQITTTLEEGTPATYDTSKKEMQEISTKYTQHLPVTDSSITKESEPFTSARPEVEGISDESSSDYGLPVQISTTMPDNIYDKERLTTSSESILTKPTVADKVTEKQQTQENIFDVDNASTTESLIQNIESHVTTSEAAKLTTTSPDSFVTSSQEYTVSKLEKVTNAVLYENTTPVIDEDAHTIEPYVTESPVKNEDRDNEYYEQHLATTDNIHQDSDYTTESFTNKADDVTSKLLNEYSTKLPEAHEFKEKVTDGTMLEYTDSTTFQDTTKFPEELESLSTKSKDGGTIQITNMIMTSIENESTTEYSKDKETFEHASTEQSHEQPMEEVTSQVNDSEVAEQDKIISVTTEIQQYDKTSKKTLEVEMFTTEKAILDTKETNKDEPFTRLPVTEEPSVNEVSQSSPTTEHDMMESLNGRGTEWPEVGVDEETQTMIPQSGETGLHTTVSDKAVTSEIQTGSVSTERIIYTSQKTFEEDIQTKKPTQYETETVKIATEIPSSYITESQKSDEVTSEVNQEIVDHNDNLYTTETLDKFTTARPESLDHVLKEEGVDKEEGTESEYETTHKPDLLLTTQSNTDIPPTKTKLETHGSSTTGPHITQSDSTKYSLVTGYTIPEHHEVEPITPGQYSDVEDKTELFTESPVDVTKQPERHGSGEESHGIAPTESSYEMSTTYKQDLPISTTVILPGTSEDALHTTFVHKENEEESTALPVTDKISLESLSNKDTQDLNTLVTVSLIEETTTKPTHSEETITNGPELITNVLDSAQPEDIEKITITTDISEESYSHTTKINLIPKEEISEKENGTLETPLTEKTHVDYPDVVTDKASKIQDHEDTRPTTDISEMLTSGIIGTEEETSTGKYSINTDIDKEEKITEAPNKLGDEDQHYTEIPEGYTENFNIREKDKSTKVPDFVAPTESQTKEPEISTDDILETTRDILNPTETPYLGISEELFTEKSEQTTLKEPEMNIAFKENTTNIEETVVTEDYMTEVPVKVTRIENNEQITPIPEKQAAVALEHVTDKTSSSPEIKYTEKITESPEQTKYTEEILTESPEHLPKTTDSTIIKETVDLSVEPQEGSIIPEFVTESAESTGEPHYEDDIFKLTKIPEYDIAREPSTSVPESETEKVFVKDKPLTWSMETDTEKLPVSLIIDDTEKSTIVQEVVTKDLITESPQIVTEDIKETGNIDDNQKITEIYETTEKSFTKLPDYPEITKMVESEYVDKATEKPKIEKVTIVSEKEALTTEMSITLVPVETSSYLPEESTDNKEVINIIEENHTERPTDLSEISTQKSLETKDIDRIEATTETFELATTSKSSEELSEVDLAKATESSVAIDSNKSSESSTPLTSYESSDITQKTDLDLTVTKVPISSTTTDSASNIDTTHESDQKIITQDIGDLQFPTDHETSTISESFDTSSEKELLEPSKVDEEVNTSTTTPEQITKAPEQSFTELHKPSTKIPESLIVHETSHTEKTVTATQSPDIHLTTMMEDEHTYSHEVQELYTTIPESVITTNNESEMQVPISLNTESSAVSAEEDRNSDDQVNITKAPEIYQYTTEYTNDLTTHVLHEKKEDKDKTSQTEVPISVATSTEEYSKVTDHLHDEVFIQPKETTPDYTAIEKIESFTKSEEEVSVTIPSESNEFEPKPTDDNSKLPEYSEQTSEPKDEHSESTPYFVELEEHTHKSIAEVTPDVYHEEVTSTVKTDGVFSGKDKDETVTEITTDKQLITEQDNQTEDSIKETDAVTKEDKQITTSFSGHGETDIFHTTEITHEISTEQPTQYVKLTTAPPPYTETEIEVMKHTPTLSDKETSTPISVEATIIPEKEEISKQEEQAASIADKESSAVTDKLDETITPIHETTALEDEFIPAVTKGTTTKITEDVTTLSSIQSDKTSPEDIKPIESVPSTSPPELHKPGYNEVLPTDDIPSTDEDSHFPSTGTSGYGQEPDYVEEDQAFGPGTCRYGGKVYVSAQQIPRDDPCDFCFCFRSDIICLQQSCPPPIHGCHEEPIQGFCCPRYECPVSMATTLNITTTTTTTTTTLPPHFLPHAYKGAAQKRGCQIKGHTYKVGEVVRASSGPCLHCTCGGDGQMKCDPKACTPEPMLRQMIAAAVSAKRRR